MSLRLLVLTALSAGLLLAQSIGSLTGLVADPQGAVIVDAEVIAENVDTGFHLSTRTNDQGGYLLPSLPVGEYRLTASKSGFQPVAKAGIRLQVDQRLTANFELGVSSVQTKVQVEAAPVLLETTTSTLSQVVDTRRINELPLNGRNVLGLLGLQAGVATRGGSLNYANSALYPTTAGYLVNNSVNGARGNQTAYKLDGGTNTNGISGIANPFPNPDAVQEFSVQTNNFSAENGGVVGGVVNVVTKSGTNELHGALWEFHRNKVLNAREFFSPAADALKRNQFGFAVGGPVWIPKLYKGRNRTFFFGSYQGTRNRRAQSGARSVAPTEAQKSGDLSGMPVAWDPLTGAPFPDNRIPLNRFDPAIVKLLGYMPAAGAGNVLTFALPSQASDDDQYVTRIDHILPGGHQLMGRYTRTNYRSPSVYLPSNLFSAAGGIGSIGDNAAGSYTHLVTPRLLTIARYTYTRLTLDLVPAVDLSVADLGAKVPKTTPGNTNISISGFSALNTQFFNNSFDKNHEVTNDWTWQTGRQNIRFGFKYWRNEKLSAGTFRSSGFYSFTGQLTGNVLADLLLGRPAQFAMRQVFGKNIYVGRPALYVQDDIRLTGNFTINIGLRWDPNRPYLDSIDMWPAFRPGLQSQRFPNAPLGLVFANEVGVPRGVTTADWNNFSPRIGFAWNPHGGANVIRAAYGIFYDYVMGQTAWRSSEPYVASTTIDAPPSFSNPYGTSTPTDPAQDLRPSANHVFTPSLTVASMEPDFRSAVIQTANFTLERRLTKSLLARTSYVTTLGTHLMFSESINPAIYRPGQSTLANINSRRLYPAFGNITEVRDGARSWYHSLQLSVQRQFGSALTFTGNYTLSKSIDTSSFAQDGGVTEGPNPFNRRSNRGLSDFDATHNFNSSVLWRLPLFGTSRRLIKSTLGGWQLNSIVSLQSGTPYSIIDDRDIALVGTGAGARADLIGNPYLPADRPRGELIAQNFNRAAFRSAPEGTFGTAGRNIMREPGYANVDASMLKDFALAERKSIQFRTEVFNLFNRPTLGRPQASLASPTFGRILSTSGSPRIIQLALRFIF